jgi:TRAP-type C4-dicarboxylate transport system permease small subunit
MKYIYSFLILTGGLIGLVGLLMLIFWLTDKVKEWSFNFKRKHEKYRLFMEKLDNATEWVVCVLVLCVLLLVLMGVYFNILKAISGGQ